MCSKVIDEFLALAYRKERKLPVIVAQLFNTVGPRQTGQYGMVIPNFVRQALTDAPRARGAGRMSLARWTRVAWWLIPVIYILLLASPSATLPGDELGIRRFHTPPLGPDLRLGQTFTMTVDGLHAIEVFPVAAGGRVSGDVRFELYEVRNNELHPVRLAEVLAEEVVRRSPYRFEFAPIPNSRDRTYRLDLVASPAEGVAFWATTGERYEGGSMHANGRNRWADLAFRVHAPAPSIWGRFMTLRETNPVRAYLVIASFTAIWLLLGLVLRTLSNVLPESDRTDPPRVA